MAVVTIQEIDKFVVKSFHIEIKKYLNMGVIMQFTIYFE